MLNLPIINNIALSVAINSGVLRSTMIYLILGIFFASAYTMLIKRFRGEFILALIEAQAFCDSSAKTISELGIKSSRLGNFFIETKFFFTPDYFIVDESEKEKRYYVDEKYVDRLESKYGNSGITFIQLLITIIAFFAVALVMSTAIPDILNDLNL